MKSAFIEKEEFLSIISAIKWEYRMVVLVSLETGLRISDVLGTTYSQLLGWEELTEKKTGKTCTIALPGWLRQQVLIRAVRRFSKQSDLAFPSARDGKKPIHRSTIYRAIKKAAVGHAGNVTPHTARKIYAVELYRKTGSIEGVRKALRHDRESTTLLYAFSDKLQQFHD